MADPGRDQPNTEVTKYIANIRRYKEGVTWQKPDGSVICERTMRHGIIVILDFRQQNWRRSH